MSVTPSYLSFVIDQLTTFGTITAKRMFGGIGLYYDGRFFGLIDDDVVFFRVDDESRAEYLAREMPAFRPVRNKPDVRSANYYQVPGEVLEDAEQLVAWARRALQASPAPTAAKQRKRARRARR